MNRVSPAQRGRAPFLPDEALDIREAFAAFTIGTAWVNHLDAETGTIEVGKRADIAILDRDVLDRGAGPIGDATVVATLLDGVPVFETGDFRALG